MNQKDAARPAFPVSETATHCGISMRDYFAAKALLGLISNPQYAGDMRLISARAYEHADAMLSERAK